MKITSFSAALALVAYTTVNAQPTTSAADLVVERINTEVYECQHTDGGAFEFTIRRGPGELALWLPFEFERPYLVLSEVFDDAESTGVFREGDVSLAATEQGAALAVGDRSFSGCAYDRVRSIWEHAKLSGGDFRASGEAPAWYLEIRHDDRLDFRSANPKNALRLSWTEIEPHEYAAGVAYLYAAGARDVEVVIDAANCDAPDGLDVRGSRVRVTVDGVIFEGCGRALH